MSQTQTLVVGSLAFDVIFSIPHDFRQSVPIEEGQIRNFNATYVANGKQEYPGGTAGNIACWLKELGENCSVFSAWGEDLETKGYHSKLTYGGTDLRGSEGEFTAHCYSVSDPLHQQLVIWQPNHYEINKTQSLLAHYSEVEIKHFNYAVFAAGTPDSILKHMTEFRTHNARATVVFDPGQVSPFFSPEEFKACVNLATIVVGNDIEEGHFNGYMQDDWPETVQRIVTLGDRGARYWENEAWVMVDPVSVKNVVETTGAGDAFRAGLITGLKNGEPLAAAIEKASKAGAACVQLPAGQPL